MQVRVPAFGGGDRRWRLAGTTHIGHKNGMRVVVVPTLRANGCMKDGNPDFGKFGRWLAANGGRLFDIRCLYQGNRVVGVADVLFDHAVGVEE